MKKAEITAESDFLQPSLKCHSFLQVFINVMFGERREFKINELEKG